MGYTTYTCTRCGDAYKGDYTEAAGHKPGDWIIDKEPTTDSEGSKHRECEVCGEKLEEETIEKIYNQATTDSKGEAVVGGYLVIVTDTDTKDPVSNAIVTLHADDTLSIRLPNSRQLDYADQTTVTVLLTKDKSAVEGMFVTMTDKHDNYCAGNTDSNGQVTVPGTSGKTTSTYLIKSILEQKAGAKVGLVGTIQNMIGDQVLHTERTTPESFELQKLFRQMSDAGCTHVVMEVSSHALVQRRVGAIDFALGVFTNLTQDHLDYHGTMEAYCDAKARLFRQCRAAAVNGDDSWTPRLLENVTCPVTRFGQGLANDLVGWDAHYCADRVSFTACSDSEHIPVTLHIPGAFSLYNALAALAAAQALGIPIEDAAQALSLCQGVRGRAEVVPTDTDYTVLIDYAHTPDGLKNILSTVCGFADARVLVVFGCGGDRDRTKRAEMGRIAARLADEVIVTSDNPRTENPYAILHEILAGMADSATPFAVLESRREAITYALDHARTGDVVVLAGKGHETYQVVGAETLPLDERQVVREHLSQ